MNAEILAMGEDSEASDYDNPAPMMMVGTTKEKKEDEAFALTSQQVVYIAATMKAAG